MIPEAAVVIVLLLCVLVVSVWDMRNTRRQARAFIRQHGLIKSRTAK